MQRRKATCPHCNKVTEQNWIKNPPEGIVRGLEFLEPLRKAALRFAAWLCLECFAANANVYEPGSPTVDVEFLRMKPEEPKT